MSHERHVNFKRIRFNNIFRKKESKPISSASNHGDTFQDFVS